MVRSTSRLLAVLGLGLATLGMTACGSATPGEGSTGTTATTGTTRPPAPREVTGGEWKASLDDQRHLTVTGPGTTLDLGTVSAGRTLQSISDDGALVVFMDDNGKTLHMLNTKTGQWRSANGIGAPTPQVS